MGKNSIKMSVVLILIRCTLISIGRQFLYLSDDSPVLSDPAVLLLQPYVVKQGQRQWLPVTAQNGLALAHVRSCEGEAAAGVGGVVANVTQSRRAAQFLTRGPEFPWKEKEKEDDSLCYRNMNTVTYMRPIERVAYLCMTRKVLVM